MIGGEPVRIPGIGFNLVWLKRENAKSPMLSLIANVMAGYLCQKLLLIVGHLHMRFPVQFSEEKLWPVKLA